MTEPICEVCGEKITKIMSPKEEYNEFYESYIVQYIDESISTTIQYGKMCKDCYDLPFKDRIVRIDTQTNRKLPVKKTKSKRKRKKLEENK